MTSRLLENNNSCSYNLGSSGNTWFARVKFLPNMDFVYGVTSFCSYEGIQADVRMYKDARRKSVDKKNAKNPKE